MGLVSAKDNNIPKNWVWTKIGDLTEPSDDKIDPLNFQECLYIGLEHIEKDTGRLLGHGSSSEVRSTKARFYAGDLLYGKLRPYLNKTIVVDFDGVCSTDIFVFPKHKHINNKYLLFRILCSDFVRYANQNVSGVQHPRVNFKTICSFLIPLPPFPEQHRIVEEIDRCFSIADEVEKIVEQSLKQANRLRQSILKTAFKGKLVPQDPKDEPAEKLLEQIREEKVKPEGKKGRKTNNKVKNLTRG